jgi:hypothetical protein
VIRRVLNIFLASPSDLQEERRITREIVDRINRVLGRSLGWQIELLGWEDTLPGLSRPQALINKDVDSCDLFLGILWRRWGQPTGKYESGFEEEYTQARGRNEKTRKPEIWLFFKDIDQESLQDPGEQLKKVIKFKSDQIERKELLFKDFSDAQTWRETIHDILTTYIVNLALQESELTTQEQSLISEESKESRSPKEATSTGETGFFPTQLHSLYEKVTKKLRGDSQTELDLWDRVRLLLQSSAWFSENYVADLFRTHEANLAYTHREEWELSESEEWYLTRSFVGDINNLLPGWYWIKEKNEEDVDAAFAWLALHDTNLNVRRRATKILAETEYNADRDVIEKLLSDEDDDIVLSTVKLVKNSRNPEFIDLLESILRERSTNVQEAGEAARIEILYMSDPNKAFSALIDSRISVPSLFKNTLEDLSLKVNDALLVKALDMASPPVRRFCAEYLRKKGLLSKENSQKLLEDTDAYVRKEGLLRLIELNEPIDIENVQKLFARTKKARSLFNALMEEEVSADQFVPLIFRRRSPQDLLDLLDFYGLYSEQAYQILAEEHFQLIESRIRSDLDDEFEALRSGSESKAKEKYGTLAESVLKAWKPETVSFVKRQFIAAALNGLAKNGKEEDIRYGRKFLQATQSYDAYEPAILLMGRFGNQQDVDSLVKATAFTYGRAKRLAFDMAFKLCGNKLEFLVEMSRGKDISTAKWAIQLLKNLDPVKTIEICKELLYSENENLRLIALAVLYKTYDFQELQGLLNDYLTPESYYYNVVTWIDRCLYAMGRYQAYYRGKVASFLFD